MINPKARALIEEEIKCIHDDALWHRHLQHENAILERETELYEARQEGIAEGRAKARAEVEAKAREKTLKTARYLLAHGVSIEIIHGCTDLPVSTIEALQK